jgi:hypothetical protein
MKSYVIIRHKDTGRAFSLGRDYMLLNPDLGNLDPPEKFVQEWDGWRSGQLPAWAENMKAEEFHAYWLY